VKNSGGHREGDAFHFSGEATGSFTARNDTAGGVLLRRQPEPRGEVAAAAAAIVDAFGRHDPEKYFSLFAPDATFVFHTTPKRLNARAEYEAEWAMWEKEDGFRVRSCKSTDQRVQILGDVAVFTDSVQTELSTTQGPSTVQERETIVFHRRGGKWVAVHEHLSPLPAPAPPAGQ
jgi:uncharacterized protein (TIGR02246 family)